MTCVLIRLGERSQHHLGDEKVLIDAFVVARQTARMKWKTNLMTSQGNFQRTEYKFANFFLEFGFRFVSSSMMNVSLMSCVAVIDVVLELNSSRL